MFGKDRTSDDDGDDCDEVTTSIPSFNKREIFKHLNQYGCSEESLDAVMSRFKLPKITAITYLNELLRRSEKYLYQECSSLCFDNIQSWLRILKKNNLLYPLESFAEYIHDIGILEEFPQPAELNGVDLRAAYKFIENALLGSPQPTLNYETAAFIAEEMQVLIEEVNNDDGDTAAYAMYDKLEQFQHPDMNLSLIKLDPFKLDR